jgi:hypothetical protein
MCSAVHIVHIVHIPDVGLDAVTTFDFLVPATGLPGGRKARHVKTGGSTPSASAEPGPAARHRDPRDEVRAGADHVLVWTSDQPEDVRPEIGVSSFYELRA